MEDQIQRVGLAITAQRAGNTDIAEPGHAGDDPLAQQSRRVVMRIRRRVARRGLAWSRMFCAWGMP